MIPYITNERWISILEHINQDLEKEKTYQGPPITGVEKFLIFYSECRDNMKCKLKM